MDTSRKCPLEFLAESAGRGFPNLLQARQRTAAGLEERRARLRQLDHGPESAVVLMGSLLALLYETRSLPQVFRDYAIF